MVKVFYGRENLDKTKFIFDNIKGKTLLLVPDQFTLQAEREAFFYLNQKAISDVDVASFSRMGKKIIATVGGKVNIIGKEGRQMLLSKIIREKQSELEIFRGSVEKIGFVEMMHDLICDFKQQNTSVEILRETCNKIPEQILLSKKLREVLVIFEEYEKKIKGKYMDNEDFISMFISKIEEADFISESDIWIYGFDSFTEKNLSIIYELAKHAKNLNIVLTFDQNSRDDSVFSTSKNIIRKLSNSLTDVEIKKISDEYIEEKNNDIGHLEKELYAIPFNKKEDKGSIMLVKASNYYNEASSSAQFILSLVRDKGYKYNDIAIICNDMENKGELYQRVFAQYGIKLFLDNKRSIKHHPGVNYITSLMDILDKNFNREDVIKHIKTGFVLGKEEDIEDLEVYAQKYKINGKLWKEDFTKGTTEYSEKELLRLNEIRENIISPIVDLNDRFTNKKTVKGKVLELYKYLEENIKLPQKIESLIKEQEQEGSLDIAEETAQIWNMITNILEQMVEILEDTKISKRDFAMLLRSGFDSVEIGIIPPSVDGLIMGSMQRTRRGKIKVTVVVSAEAGLLPMENQNIGILTEEERTVLSNEHTEICKNPVLQSNEEALSIYRNLSKTEEKLYMSYSISDDEGGTVEPSNIYIKVSEIFNNKKFTSDIFNQGGLQNLIGGIDATRNNLIAAMIKVLNGEEIDKRWKAVYNWFSRNEDIDRISKEILKEFGVEPIGAEEVLKLFKRDKEDILSLSPSRLEKFGNCPFAHFISYGLKPKENREYTVGPQEAGTIYHRCLMEVSKKINKNDKWMTATKTEVEKDVDEALMAISKEFKEGILRSGEEEIYKADRIRTVCIDTVWMAVEHVRRGKIKNMHFEVSFGRNKEIPALEIKKNSIVLEGQIDRWDILDGDYSKVIDYKSGKDSYNEREARAGLKLQLFIYLMATIREENKPGGAFYFHIDEALAKNNKNIDEEIIKQYKMDGFVLNDEEVIEGIGGNKSKTNSVFKSSKKTILDEESFNKLLDDINNKIVQMAEDISSGEIGIKPKRIKDKTSCKYCLYGGICKFDSSIDGARYIKI